MSQQNDGDDELGELGDDISSMEQAIGMDEDTNSSSNQGSGSNSGQSKVVRENKEIRFFVPKEMQNQIGLLFDETKVSIRRDYPDLELEKSRHFWRGAMQMLLDNPEQVEEYVRETVEDGQS